MKYPFSLFLLLVFLYSCQSASDNTLKKFETLDGSLRAGNVKVLASGKNGDLIRALTNVMRYVGNAKALLSFRDSTGERRDVAAVVLVHTPLGDSVRSTMLRLIAQCHGYLSDPKKIDSLNKMLVNTNAILEEGHWYKDDFTGEATIGAITLMNALETSAISAARFATDGFKFH